MIKIAYTRRLPHLQFVGAAFFMTWRLEGSIPQSVLERTQAEKEEAVYAIKRRKLSATEEKKLIDHAEGVYLQKLDDYLDKIKTGPHYLKDKAVAAEMMKKLHLYDNQYYRLEAFCVMSNHVHALLDFGIQLPEHEHDFDENKYVQLDTVMRYLKGGSSFKINKLLGRSGTLWNAVNFDRYIRNERHYNTVINYIINNPVKAGICTEWQDFPFTYLRPVD